MYTCEYLTSLVVHTLNARSVTEKDVVWQNYQTSNAMCLVRVLSLPPVYTSPILRLQGGGILTADKVMQRGSLGE